MQISQYSEYLVSNRVLPNSSKFSCHVVSGDKLSTIVDASTVDISEIHTYEIYICNPDTGESGWDIELVRSTDNLIKAFPNFDCIIT